MIDENTCKENSKLLTAVSERSKSNTHRIDKIEENQKLLYDMNTNIGILAEQTKTQGETIKEIKNDVEDIKSKPGKRWDLIVTVIITTIVSACVTALVAVIISQ